MNIDQLFRRVLLESPPRRRTGIAIDPQAREITGEPLIKRDYLTWTPKQKGRRYAVIGNPPFGLRGHLALQFINHSRVGAERIARRHRRGYGEVIRKRKREIMRLMQKIDWSQAAFTSTNGALNLRSSLIENAVIKGGFYDPRERAAGATK